MKYYYVYILVSIDHLDTHYVGRTENLKKRLAKHNKGDCSHTAKHRPWKIETATAFASLEKAVAFEKYLKSGSGREFSRRHF